jgi:hypothetical protein
LGQVAAFADPPPRAPRQIETTRRSNGYTMGPAHQLLFELRERFRSAIDAVDA